MQFKEYSAKALRTVNTKLNDKELLQNALVGMIGEVGEVADIYKKHLFQNHDLDSNKVVKELGDVCWYINLYCNCISIDPEVIDEFLKHKDYPDIDNINLVISANSIISEIAIGENEIENIATLFMIVSILAERNGSCVYKVFEENIAKLEKRYPELRFDSERSVNREQ